MRDIIYGAGMQLLSAIIEHQDEATFRKIKADWFRDNHERELYDYIRAHRRQYGGFPTATTVLEEDLGFYDETELDAPGYYLTQVSRREKELLLADFQQELQALYLEGQYDDCTRLMADYRARLNSAGSSPDMLTFNQAANQYMDGVGDAMYAGGLRGITFGYEPLDQATSGQLPGDLSLIVGRMKQGKSTIQQNMGIHAWNAGAKILVISMEMSAQQMAGRMTAQIASANSSELRAGNIDFYQYQDIRGVIDGYDNRPELHFVAGNFRKTTADIARYVAEVNPDLVLVDGAYLLGSADRNHFNQKHEKISEVASELKADAEDGDVPYLATVQFNRQASGLASRNPVENRRRMKLMDSRDGVGRPDFIINFAFDPPNYEYIEECNLSNEFDMSTIGGSDALGQVASNIIGIADIDADSEEADGHEDEISEELRELAG